MSGTLWVLSAPSGAGKTSLVNAVIDRIKNIQVSISHTTRQSRPGEKDGTHYHFVSKEVFQQMQGESGLLEWAEVFDHFYGTSRDWVERTLANNKDVILEIDWQGAEQVRQQFSEAQSIFILPPSIEALAERLQHRGQDNEVVIQRRLQEAQKEISKAKGYDYWVVNDEFQIALSQLCSIFIAHRQLKGNVVYRSPELLKQLLASG